MPRTATFETSMGTFTAELYTEAMPVTAGNFISLANEGFYDNLHFHRVIPDFMNQFGCPLTRNDPFADAAGTGGPDPHSTFVVAATAATPTATGASSSSNANASKEYTRNGEGGIPDELTTRLTNGPGTLSMANTGAPESGGSQIFINVADNSFLDWFDRSSESAHPVFGKIADNYELVERISRVRTRNDTPVQPIQVLRVRVE